MNLKQTMGVVATGMVLASSGIASAATCVTDPDETVAYEVTNRCGGGWFYFRDGTEDAFHAVEVDLVDLNPDPQDVHFTVAKIQGINSSGNPISGCQATDFNQGINGWVSDFSGCNSAVKWRGTVTYTPPVH